MAAVNRAPCTMMSANSQVVGNRACSVSRICVTPRMELSGGFRDVGHVLYYKKGITAVQMANCGGLVAEKDTKKDQKKNMKKKMKLLKGLTKDLSMLSQAEMVGETDPDGISRAAETLMQHLEEMKSKEKEVKKRRKMEKSMMKAAKAAQCGQSSSSSESCDSKCGEVVNLASMRMKTMIKPEVAKELSEVVSIITHSNIPPQLENETNKLSISNVVETVNKKIEVCMGGKCKKSGAVQLVEEFEKIVGEGAVVGCKCMGKCRDGPNVRVLSNGANASDLGKIQADLSPPPLCIGVGLEDVGVIVANFLGEGSSTSCSNQSSFAVAAAT